ncbi:MAG: membrane dipeptidase [Rhizorhabdus sp.]|uniref:dipeptidase n=1 Tax=Rhizorhabdus sp. TaxID=1968843 RepID=UPI001B4258CF|nr:membrane dipeptidase [Rhizorhabdus sp.]MBP8235105.1 membrane dipeptidase [Rhizorhabdus sp.]
MNRRQLILGAAAAAVAARGLAAPTPAVTTPRAAAVLKSTLVVNGLDGSAPTEEYLGMLKTAGVGCIHHSVAGIANFARALAFLDRNPGGIVAAGTVAEIRAAAASGRVAYIPGWQSADYLIADAGGKPAVENLGAYKKLGLRICSIAYNNPNLFGGGCLTPDVGLTADGRKLIEQIHKLNLVLDVGGHTNEKTSFDALAMSSGVPIICSHTNARAITDNARNATDKLMEAIARTGGVVGITAVSDFHSRAAKDAAIPRSPQASFAQHLDQYDYMKKLIGIDHIAMGPDFMYGRVDLNRMYREIWPAHVYSDMPWDMVKGFGTIVELPNVVEGLLARGWTPAELRKLLGENWLRVYGQVWGG